MSTYKTPGIILRRRDYAEADRIFVVLTPGGKISIIAKGIRRMKAKLSSHMELFSEIELMLVKGKNLDIVTSARIITQYDLVGDYERLKRGFLFLEMTDKLSDTLETAEIYTCVHDCLAALVLHDPTVVELVFKLKLLKLLGHAPQLEVTYDTNQPVKPGHHYALDVAQGGLVNASQSGVNTLSTESLKLWRLCLRLEVGELMKIKGANNAATTSLGVCDSFYDYIFGKRFKSSEL